MINLENSKKTDELIKNSKTIAIVAHVDPDGDSIGSIMALREILISINKKIDFYINGEIPFNYKFIKDVDKSEYSRKRDKYDLLFVLDSSDIGRLGDNKELINISDNTVCIDHHKTNEGFCDINIIEPKYSSTGEIIFEVFNKLGYEINEKASENIFISIITDTGKFIYDNANYKTFDNVSKLLKKNIDKSNIIKNLYSNEPKNVFKLKSEVFRSTEFFFNDKLAISYLSQKILKSYSLGLKDIDGLVERLRDIEDVEISVLIKQIKKNEFKVSMRSIGDIDVSFLCSKFNGGGHKNAAGFGISDLTYEELKKMIIEEVSKYAV